MIGIVFIMFYPCDGRQRASLDMLFKTQSASVYGIDAYLVEVEVDVGSARMKDFNVVGLPDNAVKESRERIKAALRNCGYEFPYGQGVTINLAPADVREEGSGFDLPMALGLAGCMGQFFGKQLDKCMFLGELSLDGSVRPVRGALSAALAAREFGLKSLALPEANAKETPRIHSVAGVLEDSRGLLGTRPYRSPHHTISDAGLIGGGAVPRPGEVSLGHNGVLFLDELPEFQRNVLEVMRQPLEDGAVTISRAAVSVTFPSRFMLAAAMNPCPCGYFGDPTRECHCTPPMIQRYVSKITGPLLDRIDIHIEVPTVKYKELRAPSSAEDSASVRQRVIAARNRQLERFQSEKKTYANAQMMPKMIRKHCAISTEGEKLLENAITRLGLSARAHDRILKVARTIADLDGGSSIEPRHLSEAIQYRTLDRSYWA